MEKQLGKFVASQKFDLDAAIMCFSNLKGIKNIYKRESGQKILLFIY